MLSVLSAPLATRRSSSAVVQRGASLVGSAMTATRSGTGLFASTRVALAEAKYTGLPYQSGYDNHAKPINVKKALPPPPGAVRKSQRKKNDEKIDGLRTEKTYRFRLRRMLFPQRRVFSKEEREAHKKVRKTEVNPFKDGKMVSIIERSQELTCNEVLEQSPSLFKHELFQFMHLLEERYIEENKKKGIKTWLNPNFIKKDDPRYIPVAANTPGNKFTILDIFARGCLNFCIRRHPNAIGKNPNELDPMADFMVSLLPEARVSQFASRMNGSGVREGEFYAKYGALKERYAASTGDKATINSHKALMNKYTLSPESKLKSRFREEAKRNKVWSQVNAQGLSHIIPTYFVPISEVLKHLPGYTEEHLEFAFKDGMSVVMRKLCGRTWIRIHGGQNRVDFARKNEADKLFPQYKPDPKHLAALKEILLPDGPLAPKPGEEPKLDSSGKPIVPLKWVPVDIIFRKAPPALLNSFKPIFNSPQETLVFFDQMAHQLAVTVSGNADAKNELWVTVAWLPDGNDGLDYTTSPIPHVCQDVMKMLVNTKSTPDTIVSKLKPQLITDMKEYFPDIKSFLKAHSCFAHDVRDDLYYLLWQKKYHDNKDLTDEERLTVLMSEANQGKDSNWSHQQRFKRLIMKKKHTESPFASSDEDLLKALIEFLPKKTHVTVNEFCQTIVPQELSWWLPSNVVHWFKKFPEMVQCFEVGGQRKFGDRACITRLGNPLPRSALKTEFTEDESLKLMINILRRTRGGALSAAHLLARLPLVVQDNFSHHRRDFFTGWLDAFPQYFQLIYTDAVRMDARGTVVHLVDGAHMPGESAEDIKSVVPEEAPEDEAGAMDIGVGGGDEEEDPDALGNKTKEVQEEQEKLRAEDEAAAREDEAAQALAAEQIGGSGYDEEEFMDEEIFRAARK